MNISGIGYFRFYVLLINEIIFKKIDHSICIENGRYAYVFKTFYIYLYYIGMILYNFAKLFIIPEYYL